MNIPKKNAYLLLNMPTSYEIAIKQFDFYPAEIKGYFNNLYRTTTQTGISASQLAKVNLQTGYDTRNIIQQPYNAVPQQLTVRGGKVYTTRKYKKNKITKRTRRTRRTTKNKTRKHVKQRNKKTNKLK